MIDFTAKRVLTFDCYGTLIDWETGILSALQPIVTDHGVTANPEHLLALYAQLEPAAEQGPYTPYRQLLMAVLRGLGERLGFTPSAAEQSRFADSVGDWPPFGDAPAALGALKRRFRLAIISNIDDDLFARTNQKLDVVFDWIITAQQVRSYKPSLNNFRQSLARIGLPTEQVLHVAQSLFHDHVPAKQLGLETIWINRRHGKAGSGATPYARPGDTRSCDTRTDDRRRVAAQIERNGRREFASCVHKCAAIPGVRRPARVVLSAWRQLAKIGTGVKSMQNPASRHVSRARVQIEHTRRTIRNSEFTAACVCKTFIMATPKK